MVLHRQFIICLQELKKRLCFAVDQVHMGARDFSEMAKSPLYPPQERERERDGERIFADGCSFCFCLFDV